MKVVVFVFLYNLFFILYNEDISCIKLIEERRAYGVLVWMAIGIALMAVELVVPGGILGLIGYCTFLWGVYVALGEGTVRPICRTRINSLVNCPYHRVL